MIAIVTDSTCDLPDHLVRDLQIRVVPAVLVINGQVYADGVDLSRTEFYSLLPDLPAPPTTAAPSAGAIARVYGECFESGADHIVSLHVAETLSGICNAARVAADAAGERVTVVDSGQLSLGLGFQVLAAAECAAAGGSLDEVLAAADHTRRRIQVIAMLDSLEYLRRSGRVSQVKAMVGALLRMRFFVELFEGQVSFLDQVRTRGRALNRLWELIVSLGRVERFALLHANAESEARMLLDRLEPDLHGEVLLVNVTTVIGTHVGPGALGFAAVLHK